jgi:uncharacterized protein (DUF433 family)
MATVSYPHIEITEEGVPMLSGTQTKVMEVALDRIAHHWDADEIQRQHPHLSLAQIHSALAYYYDHREDLDRAIQNGLERAARIEEKIGASPLAARLRRGD